MDRTLLLGLAACVVGIVLLFVVAADIVLARRTVNRALRQATLRSGDPTRIPSTKGVLA